MTAGSPPHSSRNGGVFARVAGFVRENPYRTAFLSLVCLNLFAVLYPYLGQQGSSIGRVCSEYAACTTAAEATP
jgi:hypothetical protein